MSLYDNYKIVKKISEEHKRLCIECKHVQIGDAVIAMLGEDATLTDYIKIMNNVNTKICAKCNKKYGRNRSGDRSTKRNTKRSK